MYALFCVVLLVLFYGPYVFVTYANLSMMDDGGQHLAGRAVHTGQLLTLKVLVATIDAQWEGMGDVGSARYELALLPPCLTIRVLSYSN